MEDEPGELADTNKSLDEPESAVGDGDNDEEEEEDAGDFSSQGLEKPTIDWSRYNPYRTRMHEVLRIIRQAGASGVDRRKLQQAIGCTQKQLERLIGNLKRANLFKCLVESEGKRRTTK